MNGPSEREQQVREALERESYLLSLDKKDLAELRTEHKAAWEVANAALRAVEPLHNAMIARLVRKYEPAATSIAIEPTDQGGPGWVYAGDNDDVRDDDELSMLLSDLGEFLSSEDHPAQDYDFSAKP